MKLVYQNTTQEVKIGDKVHLSHDKGPIEVTVDFFRPPHKPSSEGKVTIRRKNGNTDEYYVSVVGLEWIEREDRDNG